MSSARTEKPSTEPTEAWSPKTNIWLYSNSYTNIPIPFSVFVPIPSENHLEKVYRLFHWFEFKRKKTLFLIFLKEEEEVEYNEEEEAIKNNLETEEALSNEVLDSILQQWWHKEPFK